jgi:8-oxo-dGTP diphosphatase
MKGKVAAVIFINEENKFLFYLRDDKPTIPYPNKWALLGGHVEEGESLREGLEREIKEEINFNIKNPVFIDSVDDYVGNIVYIYKSKINKSLEELHLTEGQKLGYFNFEEAMKIGLSGPLKSFIIKNKEKIFN